jgi:hypothetical protein
MKITEKRSTDKRPHIRDGILAEAVMQIPSLTQSGKVVVAKVPRPTSQPPVSG